MEYNVPLNLKIKKRNEKKKEFETTFAKKSMRSANKMLRLWELFYEELGFEILICVHVEAFMILFKTLENAV